MTAPTDCDPSMFSGDAKHLGDLDHLDFIAGFIPHFSFELQLRAMRAIIGRNKKARDDLQTAIDQLNEKGSLNEREIDYYGDLFYECMYQDSANSLVLSALMTAFLEEFFTTLYSALSKKHSVSLESRRPFDPRWTLSAADKWRPEVAQIPRSAGRRGLASGIFELARAIDLYLPSSLDKLYDALTAYRNAIVHNALDWEPKELMKFTDQIAKRGWNRAWFEVTTTNDVPSMYALTDLFANELMMTIDKTLDETGKFVKALLS